MPKNIVVMGDIFGNASYPDVNLASGGSVRGLIDTVDRVLAASNDETRIIPGSAPIATRADLEAYRRMLATAEHRVRTLITEGKTMDQVVAAAPTKDLDAEWGGSARRCAHPRRI